MSLSLIATVQSAAGSTTSPITLLALNVQVGDLIVVGARLGRAATTITGVSDNASTPNTFTPLTPANSGAATAGLFYCIVTTANAADVISIAASNSTTLTNFVGCAWQIRGASATPLDKQATGTNAGTSPLATSAFTTTNANEIIVAMATGNTANASQAWSSASGDSVDSAGFPAAVLICAQQHKIVSTIQTGTTESMTFTQAGSTLGIIVSASFMAAAQPSGLSTVLAPAPIPAKVTNSSGYSLPITSPTLGTKIGQPTCMCFCDANGNELAVTGATVGSFIASPVPVVLCDPTGHPLIAPFVFTSNGNSITVSATLTGVKMGQPKPVVATDPNGFLYNLSGFTLGTLTGNPTPICLTDVNGNVLTLSGVAT